MTNRYNDESEVESVRKSFLSILGALSGEYKGDKVEWPQSARDWVSTPASEEHHTSSGGNGERRGSKRKRSAKGADAIETMEDDTGGSSCAFESPASVEGEPIPKRQRTDSKEGPPRKLVKFPQESNKRCIVNSLPFKVAVFGLIHVQAIFLDDEKLSEHAQAVATVNTCRGARDEQKVAHANAVTVAIGAIAHHVWTNNQHEPAKRLERMRSLLSENGEPNERIHDRYSERRMVAYHLFLMHPAILEIHNNEKKLLSGVHLKLDEALRTLKTVVEDPKRRDQSTVIADLTFKEMETYVRFRHNTKAEWNAWLAVSSKVDRSVLKKPANYTIPNTVGFVF